MDLHSSRKGSTQNICHAVAFKIFIRILFSLSSVKSRCKRYTCTAIGHEWCQLYSDELYRRRVSHNVDGSNKQEVRRIQHGVTLAEEGA